MRKMLSDGRISFTAAIHSFPVQSLMKPIFMWFGFCVFEEGFGTPGQNIFFFFLPSMSLELCIFVDYRKTCFFSSIKQDILLKLLVIFTLVNTFC